MTHPHRLAIAGLIAGFVLFDLFLAEMLDFRGDLHQGLVLGIAIGQVNLIAIWGTVASGPVVGRIPWAILLGGVMWLAITLGNFWTGVWSRQVNARPEALTLGLLIFLGIAVTGAPLWIARRWVGTRLVPPGKFLSPATDQFNLWQLLLGMTLVCVFLAVAKAILPPGPNRVGLHRELWVLLPVAAVVNLIVVVPTVWMAFVRGRWLLRVLVLALPVYAIAISVAEVMILIAFLGRPPNNVYLTFSLFNLMQCATVGGTLGFLRLLGFMLQHGERKEASAAPVVTLEKSP